MILETIVGLSAIYVLAKAQKPQAKPVVKKITTPTPLVSKVIEEAKKEAVKVSDVPIVRESPVEPPKVSDVPVVRTTDITLQELPNQFGTPSDLGFFRYFKSEAAHKFGLEMEKLGFQGIPKNDVSADLWNKFFFWLRFEKMPDVNAKLQSVPAALQRQMLVEEADKRGILSPSNFASLKAYVTPKKGSNTTITQTVAQAKAEYQRQAEAAAAVQAAAAREAEAKRVAERDVMLAEKKAKNSASAIAAYSAEQEVLKTAPWQQVRDIIYNQLRSALMPTAFQERIKSTPIVGGPIESLPNVLVMPDGYAFLPDGVRFAYFTNPEGTIYYATGVFYIPGRKGEPVIAGRQVSKEEYDKAKKLLGL